MQSLILFLSGVSVDVKQQGMNHNVAGRSFPVIQGLKDEVVIVNLELAFPAGSDRIVRIIAS